MSHVVAARYDFTMFRGEAPRLVVGPIKDLTGAVIDVTGWSDQLTIRAQGSSPDPPLLTKAGASHGASPTLGFRKYELTRAETLTLPPGNYAYSCMRVNSGFEDVYTYGILTILNSIRDAQ